MVSTLKNPELETQGIEPFEDSFEQIMSKTSMQHTLTDHTAFPQLLKTQKQALHANKTREQFLVVKFVLEAEFSWLADEVIKLPVLLSYHRKTGILIVKITPGIDQHFAVKTFWGSIGTQISLMGLRWEMDTLTTPTISIGDWYRVADCCWSPAGKNPSLVPKVEPSESSEKLASTAKGWLDTPGSSVQMVVTIDISRDEARVLITLWELGTTMAQLPSTRRAVAIETSLLNGETVVVGEQYPDSCHNGFDDEESSLTTDLVLPFKKIVGRSPEEWFEKDFRIYKVKLEHLAELVWQRQGFMPK